MGDPYYHHAANPWRSESRLVLYPPSGHHMLEYWQFQWSHGDPGRTQVCVYRPEYRISLRGICTQFGIFHMIFLNKYNPSSRPLSRILFYQLLTILIQYGHMLRYMYFNFSRFHFEISTTWKSITST